MYAHRDWDYDTPLLRQTGSGNLIFLASFLAGGKGFQPMSALRLWKLTVFLRILAHTPKLHPAPHRSWSACAAPASRSYLSLLTLRRACVLLGTGATA